jgi:hypothetical protein
VTLSVCCLTCDPGPRVAALLELLRPVADEIVIGADTRADEASLRDYAAVADRVLPVRFEYLERHLAWLHEQCTGDWVLRLDTDEVPSAALLAALPGLTARTDVQQVWFPRRWCHPDAAHWLDELPWSPDYQLRMVRRDARLRFPGGLHSSAAPVRPALYAEEPLYHLVCLLEPFERRRSKALRYEVLQPGRQAAGGGPLNETFFLPERRASGMGAVAVPAADRTLIAGVLEECASASDASMPAPVEAEAGPAAMIEALEDPVRMYAGERREVFVRVTNTTGEPWSWDADREPRYRMSYRWHARGAGTALSEGERTAFPHAIAPGASAVVPLVVQAPDAAGEYDLLAGILIEGVRWCEPLQRIAAHAKALPAPPCEERPGARRAKVVRVLRRGGRMQIPRVVHRIWLGDVEMPAQYVHYGETWREHHPDWELRLWGDAEIAELGEIEALARARHHSERSDILRYELLRRHGGVYVDTDVECLRPFDPLLADVRVFAAWEVPGRMCGAVMGAVPGHRAFERAVTEVGNTVGLGTYPDNTGPVFLTAILADDPDVTVFEPHVFYPYLWDQPERRGERFPGSYAVHHWAQTWSPDRAAATEA